MESPVTLVKSAFSPGKLIVGALGIIAVAAVFDVLGFTDALLRPVSFIKAKFFSKAAA